MSRKVIAVCGKGGVGKTTVSAILAAEICKRGAGKALVVDADPAGGLGMALGMAARKSINKLRVETIAQIKKKEVDKRDLAREIDFLLAEGLTERGNLAFLSIGRPEEVGCYCSVNSLLREAIDQLADKFDVTLIDAEAGIEQVNRKVVGRVDHLWLVADGSLKALAVAETIARVYRGLNDAGRAVLILNRLELRKQADAIAAQTDLPLIGWIPEDAAVRRFDAEARSFFDLADSSAARAVVEIIDKTGVL